MPSTAGSGQLASGAVAPRKTTAIAGAQAAAFAVTHRHGWVTAPRSDQAWAAPSSAPMSSPRAAAPGRTRSREGGAAARVTGQHPGRRRGGPAEAGDEHRDDDVPTAAQPREHAR